MTRVTPQLLCAAIIALHVQFSYAENDFFVKIQSGMKFVGKLIGIEKAADVANLVNAAFARKSSYPQSNETNKTQTNLLSGFFRLLGLDSKKLGAVAVNAIIFLAQMLSSTLIRKPTEKLPEPIKGSLLKWMLHHPKVEAVMTSIQDKMLPEQIIDYVRERSLDEETGCVQLLICKSSPLIWGMQKAVNHSKHGEVFQAKTDLFQYLPNIEDMKEKGDDCDKKYPYCFIDYSL